MHLFADIETLKLLKKMAGSLRRQSNDSDTIEEFIRTADRDFVSEWTNLLAARKRRRPLPRTISKTSRNAT